MRTLVISTISEAYLKNSKKIDAFMEEVCKLISKLNYRYLWDKDVQQIDFVETKINRIGTPHNCVLQFGSLNFETIFEKSQNSLIYVEKTKT